MSTANKVNMITNSQIKAIWGASKNKGLSKDDLYSIINTISKKEHMSELTYVEAAKVLDRINNNRQNKVYMTITGNTDTKTQRLKICYLFNDLGWTGDNVEERINGFCKKIFKIERLEWLSKYQCSKLIEILKQMIKDRDEKVEQLKMF